MAIREFDDAALDQLARSVAKALSEHRSPRSNWDRRLTILIGIATIVSLIFSLGVNWSQVSENARALRALTQRVDGHDTELKALRQEVSSQSTAIQQQLGEIKAQLGEIRGALSRR